MRREIGISNYPASEDDCRLRACHTRRAAVRSSMAMPTDLKRMRRPVGAAIFPARMFPISACTLAPERRKSPDSRSTAELRFGDDAAGLHDFVVELAQGCAGRSNSQHEGVRRQPAALKNRNRRGCHGKHDIGRGGFFNRDRTRACTRLRGSPRWRECGSRCGCP